MERRRHVVDFLDVEHEAIIEPKTPYFMGQEINISIRVRNKKNESIHRRFCYIIEPPIKALTPHIIEFRLGSQEEVTRKLGGSPYYLAFVGVFRMIILTGEDGELINGGSNSFSSPYRHQTLFSGYSRDKVVYEIRRIIRILTIITAIFTGVMTVLTAILALGL